MLKFLTCDQLYERHPGAHEGSLALRKDAIVSNTALVKTGMQLGLHRRLTLPFQCATRLWPDLSQAPPLTLLQPAPLLSMTSPADSAHPVI